MQKLSLYVHWPFCESKCPYCDFNSHVSNNIDIFLWQKSFLIELDYMVKNILPDAPKSRLLSSIFFGGGTPSLMNHKIVESIINYCYKIFKFSRNIEITLEANPKSTFKENLKYFKRAGVNRLSIGIQSFSDKELTFLGRLHTARDAFNTLDQAFTVFDNVSFDLIYGLPKQKLSEWEKNLSIAFSFNPKHLSLYQLTIEKGTAFHREYLNKNLIPINDNRASKFYDFTFEKTESYGLNNYEISNYSYLGEECVHNLVYWNGGDWLGIGPGAHGRVNLNQYSRLVTETRKSPNGWLKNVSDFGNGINIKKTENKFEFTLEKLIMGLRQKGGVEYSKVKNIINLNSLKSLIALKKLEIDGNHLKASYSGRKLLNSVLLKLVNY